MNTELQCFKILNFVLTQIVDKDVIIKLLINEKSGKSHRVKNCDIAGSTKISGRSNVWKS